MCFLNPYKSDGSIGMHKARLIAKGVYVNIWD